MYSMYPCLLLVVGLLFLLKNPVELAMIEGRSEQLRQEQVGSQL